MIRKKARWLAALSAAVIAGSASVSMMPSASVLEPQAIIAQQAISKLDASEAAVLDSVAAALGYGGAVNFVAAVLAANPQLPTVDRIKDLTGDGKADAFDAQYLLRFLNGHEVYEKSYTDLDVTGDYIVDQSDATAYLSYYTYYAVLGSGAPFSASNGKRTVDASFEERSYWRYDFQTQTVGSSSYTLTMPTESPTALEEEDVYPIATTNSFVKSDESRVVKIKNSGGYGSGFIVSDHVIATCAHVVYTYSANPQNGKPSSDSFEITGVEAYLYDSSGNQKSTDKLTVLSVHVPNYYIN